MPHVPVSTCLPLRPPVAVDSPRVQEDDVHLATLTVGQTLSFALSSKTPGKRLPDTSTTDFRKQVSDTLLKMLNIQHTKNTIVGDQFTRGVSGGERKRVSIAEMMAAG